MLETSLSHEEVALARVSETETETRGEDKTLLEICRKRKRSDEEEEKEGVVEEEENDGFKTPTRPENRIPEPRECPWAPRRGGRVRGKTTTSCRRRLNFPPENVVNSFITDLQRKTVMTMKK